MALADITNVECRSGRWPDRAEPGITPGLPHYHSVNPRSCRSRVSLSLRLLVFRVRNAMTRGEALPMR